MTFDVPQRLFRAASRRRATMAIGLTLAVLAVAAGCWEEIRYEPSQASTRVEQVRKPTEEEPKGVEPKVAPQNVPEATEEPARDPLTGELFGEEEPSADSGAAADAEPAPTGDMTGAPLSFETAEPAAEGNGATAFEAASPVAPVTPQERLDAWKAASGWSLAVAVSAKGLPADRYQSYLADAELAAGAIGIELPSIPEVAEGDESGSVIAESLRTGEDVELVRSVGERLDGSAAASARLAVDTHYLLLTYSPETAGEVASSLAVSAEAAELPGRLWQPLVGLLTEGADFQEVRAAVFALHKAAAEHFEQAAGTGE